MPNCSASQCVGGFTANRKCWWMGVLSRATLAHWYFALVFSHMSWAHLGFCPCKIWVACPRGFCPCKIWVACPRGVPAVTVVLPSIRTDWSWKEPAFAKCPDPQRSQPSQNVVCPVRRRGWTETWSHRFPFKMLCWIDLNFDQVSND